MPTAPLQMSNRHKEATCWQWAATRKDLRRNSGGLAVIDPVTLCLMTWNTTLSPYLVSRVIREARSDQLASYVKVTPYVLSRPYFRICICGKFITLIFLVLEDNGRGSNALREQKFDQCWESEVGNDSKIYTQLEYNVRVSPSQQRRMSFPLGSFPI